MCFFYLERRMDMKLNYQTNLEKKEINKMMKLDLYESRLFGRICYGFVRDEKGYVYIRDDEAEVYYCKRTVYEATIRE